MLPPLAPFDFDTPQIIPDKINELVGLQKSIYLNVRGGNDDPSSSATSVGRALRLMALDDLGRGMKDQEVKVEIQRITILDPTGVVDCNSATQERLNNTLEGQNIRHVCTPVWGQANGQDTNKNMTDELGLTSFRNMDLASGPPGMYLSLIHI